jgi:hypothetical protein
MDKFFDADFFADHHIISVYSETKLVLIFSYDRFNSPLTD